MNAISEIGQWTRDIRHKAGKHNLVADMLSRPSQLMGDSYLTEELAAFKGPNRSDKTLSPQPVYAPSEPVGGGRDPQYIPPERTLAALQQVALMTLSPSSLATAQQTCPQTKNHLNGLMPKNVSWGSKHVWNGPGVRDVGHLKPSTSGTCSAEKSGCQFTSP